MKRRRRLLRVAACAVVLLWIGNWLFGGGSAERALRDFEQHVLDACTSRLGAGPGVFRVDGYRVARRVVLLGLSYYEGQPLVENRDVSCADRAAVILWYGFGSLVVWQDGVWFPDRAVVWKRVAETGHEQ